MIWKWLRKRPRLPVRAERKRITLELEQLENRLLPASMLDNFLPNFNDTAVQLYGGGAVSHLATVQTSGEPISLYETGSGNLGTEATFSYSVETTGLTNSLGTALYEQEYVYSFDNSFIDADGATIHEWGTYRYLFNVSTTSTHTQFSFVAELSYHQTASLSEQTTEADGSTTAVAWNSQLDQDFGRTISNYTDLGAGTAEGSDGKTGSSDKTYAAAGTYSYAIPSGVVNGTFAQNGQDHSGYSYMIDASRNSSGAWSHVGNGATDSSGEDHATYTGAGSYSSSDASSSSSGTSTESGADNSHYHYVGSYTLDDTGVWQVGISTGDGGGHGYSNSSYSGSGTFSLVLPNETASGSSTRDGGADSDYIYSFSAVQQPDYSWGFSGSATMNWSGEDHSSYTGTGAYSASNATLSTTGTTIESGADHSDYSYTTNYNIDLDGSWQVLSGAGSGSGSGFGQSSYEGSGTYSIADSHATAAGTSTQNGHSNSGYTYTFIAAQAIDGTWNSAGAGTINSSREHYSSYTGAGTYSTNDGAFSSGGTTTESGSANSQSSYSTDFTIDTEGNWHISTGTGSGSGSGINDSSYTGSGTYSLNLLGSTASGAFTENGQTSSGYSYTFDAIQSSNGQVSFTGSATRNSSGEDHSTHTGGGSYSTSDSHSSSTGTTTESGADNSHYQATTSYTIASDGSWQIASGAGSGGGNGFSHSAYSGAGTYSIVSSDGTAAGSFGLDGQTSLQYDYTFNSSHGPDGISTFSGNGTTNISGDEHSTYSGTGTYTTSDPSLSSSGTTARNGADSSTYQFSTTYTMGSDGAWQIASGAGTGAGNGFIQSSYTGTGTYSAVLLDSTASGTSTENGQASSNYSYAFTASLGSDGLLSFSGSAATSTAGANHSTYAGTGSFAVDGDGFSSTGTTTTSGADNSHYEFSTNYAITSDGSWKISDGIGSGDGDGFTQSSYDAVGTYSSVLPDATTNGSFTQNGQFDSHYSYNFSAIQGTDGILTYTGNGAIDSSGEDHSTYSGTGTYNISDGTTSASGTTAENGADNSAFEFSASYTLASDGSLQISSGTGSGGGDGFAQSSYSGGGTYSFVSTDVTAAGTFAHDGAADTDYSYSYTATQSASAGLTFAGSVTTNVAGEDHFTYAGASTYVAGIISGTTTENASHDSSYEYSLTSTIDDDGNRVGGSGLGTSQGSGTYAFTYTGSGSALVTTTVPIPDGTSTSTVDESGSHSGQLAGGYTFSTSSTFSNGAWITTGTETHTGSGSDNSSYDRISTLSESTNANWSDSSGSGTSSSSLNRTETSGQTWNQSYQFTTVLTLAADSSITVTETSAGSGASAGYYTLNASGAFDSTTDMTGENSTVHSESHGTSSQTASQQYAASWQWDVTTVAGPAGTLTTGSMAGTSSGSGAATSMAQSSGMSNSTWNGPDSSSQSHSDWSSATSANDYFDYQSPWSITYDANGVPTDSFNPSNHVWGTASESYSNNWSNSTTTIDPVTGEPTTATDSGTEGFTNDTPYNQTIGSFGFAGASTDIGKSDPFAFARWIDDGNDPIPHRAPNWLDGAANEQILWAQAPAGPIVRPGLQPRLGPRWPNPGPMGGRFGPGNTGPELEAMLRDAAIRYPGHAGVVGDLDFGRASVLQYIENFRRVAAARGLTPRETQIALDGIPRALDSRGYADNIRQAIRNLQNQNNPPAAVEVQLSPEAGRALVRFLTIRGRMLREISPHPEPATAGGGAMRGGRGWRRTPPPGLTSELHHAIPHEDTPANPAHNHQNHQLVRWAGVDLTNYAGNVRPLLGHRGRHTNDYHRNITERLDYAQRILETLDREYRLTDEERGFYARILLDEVINSIWEDIGSGALRPYGPRHPDVYLP